MIDAADLAVLKTARQMKRLQSLIGSKRQDDPLVKALMGNFDKLMGQLVDDISNLDSSREASIDG